MGARVLIDVVERADADGRLRAVLDAVRSHRVEDDFSDVWTFAREDFERKLHHKGAKEAKVRFVELTRTTTVLGPETQVVGNTATADFIALLSPRDRQIVVLLSSGTTRLADIAEELGYSTPSAISTRLARIRREANDASSPNSKQWDTKSPSNPPPDAGRFTSQRIDELRSRCPRRERRSWSDSGRSSKSAAPTAPACRHGSPQRAD